jgi:hypothetical protein
MDGIGSPTSIARSVGYSMLVRRESANLRHAIVCMTGRVRPRPIVPQAAVWLPRGANALPTLAYGFSGALNAR